MAESNEFGKRQEGRRLTERAKELLFAGDEASAKEAIRSLDAAMDLGCGEAFYVRGMAYLSGAGGEKSDERAFETFRKGREAGDAGCCLELFCCLIRGRGCERDEGEAMACLREACSENHPRALYILGMCEICGFSLERNVADGIWLVSKAAALGSKDAADAIIEMDSGEIGSLAPGVPSDLSAREAEALRDGEARVAAAAIAGWTHAEGRGISWLKWTGMARRRGSDKAPMAEDAAKYLDFAKCCKNFLLDALERERAEAARTGSGRLPLRDALGGAAERMDRLEIELHMMLDDIAVSPSGEEWNGKWDSLVRALAELRVECSRALKTIEDRREGGAG